MSQSITPFLWFNENAEEAMNFYLSVFPNSKVLEVTRYGAAGPGPEGQVMVVKFELNGEEFIALNGNKQYEFNHAVSFVVNCKDQEEIDYYWEKLTAGGKEVACGWLTDKFGLSWQITPVNIKELIDNPGGMKAMMNMVKLDIAKLKEAASNG